MPEPFIPRQDASLTKLFDAALVLCEHVLMVNGIPMPRVVQKRLGGHYGLTCMGQDGTSCITVDVRHCRPPTKTPGFAWSFPASPKDCTPAGVLAHEFGHAVLNWLERDDKSGSIRRRIMAVEREEAPVTSYGAGSAHEQFAEMFRVAVLDPDLLREGRPKRWELLQSLGLTFPETVPWRDVLLHAHPRIIRAAENWIKKASSAPKKTGRRKRVT